MLILACVFLSGFIALGLNTARLLCVRAELHAACEAAALAGVAELLDEGEICGNPDIRDDILMARESARLAGLRNYVDGRGFRLDPNSRNLPGGHIVVGSVEPLGPVGMPLGIPPDIDNPGAVNTLRVTGRLSQNTFNKVSLWLGGLTGVTTADPACVVQATLDQRVAGFRPEPGVKVPVVPLIAEYDAWIEQSLASPTAGVNDNFGFDPFTGQVTAGPDGIPELVFVCGVPNSEPPTPDDEPAADASATEAPAADGEETEETAPPQAVPGWCVVPDLFNELNIDYVWPVRAREGLSRGDLSAYGGQLVLNGPTLNMAVLPAMPGELAYGLMDIIGSTRAWPLADAVSASSEYPSCEVVDFAAGRIVAVRRTPDTQNSTWEIVVQPTTLVSSQAVTGSATPRNPWIGKLELTQ
ncbi:MAG: hypothetical protein C0483_05360 [Pirellula sp.]|nr:hypothetical protein [Pirellula sp.]